MSAIAADKREPWVRPSFEVTRFAGMGIRDERRRMGGGISGGGEGVKVEREDGVEAGVETRGEGVRSGNVSDIVSTVGKLTGV